MTAELISLEGISGRYTIKEVRLDNAEIAYSASTPDPVKSATTLAHSKFGSVNGQVKAAAETLCAQLRNQEQDELNIRNLIQHKRENTTGNLYAKTISKGDPSYQLSDSERFQVALYSVFRYITLGVSVTILALYARASGFSADISSNFLLALAYGFPSLIVSSMLANFIDYTVDLERKNKFAKWLSYAAGGCSLLWVVSSAIVFAPQDPSVSDFQVSFSAPPSSDSPISMLFPASFWGGILLSFHILTDVLTAAALTAHSKIVGLRGRETEFTEPTETKKHRELYCDSSSKLSDIEANINMLEGVLQRFRDGEATCVQDSVNRIQFLMLEITARQTQVKVDVIYRAIQPASKGA